MYRFTEIPDLAALREHAFPWLLTEEVRHNFLLGRITRLEHAGDEPTLLLAVHGPGDQGPGDRLCGVVLVAAGMAAISTLPEDAVLPLVQELHRRLEKLSGLHGSLPLAERLAAAWVERRGVPPRLLSPMRLYRLGELRWPEPRPAGAVRPGTEDDHELASAWLEAFVADAGALPMATAGEARYQVEHGELIFWDDDGRTVSMAGVTGRTPHGARLGWVYTPPEERGRGFGAAVTAALSERVLAGGADFCCLNTDRENPVTNRLYQRLGYEPVGEEAVILFSE